MNLGSPSMSTKALALVLLMALLCVALSQVGSLVEERGLSRDQAAAELAQTHAGPQTLVGPVLLVPYIERWSDDQRDSQGRVTGTLARSKRLTHVVFPETLNLEGKLMPQERYRGIFTVLFYELQAGITGRFGPVTEAAVPHSQKDSTIELLAPLMALGLGDARGIAGAPGLLVAGETLRIAQQVPGAPEGSWLARGVHAPLAGAARKAFEAGAPLAFELKLSVLGQGRLAVAAIAGQTTAHLSSPWQHPSFGGRFLASQRSVGERGFDAHWSVSSLVSSAPSQVLLPATQALDTFDVSLAQPVNVYAMSTRAVKYGALFVGLVVMAVFMFELLRKLRLHPVQYALVGLSLVLFFLLLLALSEKVEFALAYGLAAGASVAVLGLYFGAVLGGWLRGAGLAAFVALLYGALYGLLASESNALLLGALLLFGMVATLMMATRRVDWYALGGPVAVQGSGTAAA